MKYIFADEYWEDYLYWQATDKKIPKRINDLLKDISGNPFSEIGKPEEPLKFKYKGSWSRRINEEHRLIYQVKENEILIAKCRFNADHQLEVESIEPKKIYHLGSTAKDKPEYQYCTNQVMTAYCNMCRSLLEMKK